MNSDILTDAGKKEFERVLNAKVENIGATSEGNIKIFITGTSAHRIEKFSEIVSGRCTREEYDKWVAKENIIVAEKDETPILDVDSKTVNLIATYECLTKIPYEERLTVYFGDMGDHYIKTGISYEKVDEAFKKALDVMEMSKDEYMENHSEFIYRKEVEYYMRGKMLAGLLKTGQEVVYIPTEPDESCDFNLSQGKLISLNNENGTCEISDNKTVKTIPLRYVFGVINERIRESHFGFKNCEVLLGATDNDVYTLLAEAETNYEINHSESTDMDMTI